MNRKAMYERIEKHGRALLAIFPDATERDPVKLCKKLRRIEASAHNHVERRCNEDVPESEHNRFTAMTRNKLAKLLSSDRVWLNGDPRGYALKIDLEPGEELHRDWGGYGIIAPDLMEGGE